jgi:hypothetical protein
MGATNSTENRCTPLPPDGGGVSATDFLGICCTHLPGVDAVWWLFAKGMARTHVEADPGVSARSPVLKAARFIHPTPTLAHKVVMLSPPCTKFSKLMDSNFRKMNNIKVFSYTKYNKTCNHSAVHAPRNPTLARESGLCVRADQGQNRYRSGRAGLGQNHPCYQCVVEPPQEPQTCYLNPTWGMMIGVMCTVKQQNSAHMSCTCVCACMCVSVCGVVGSCMGGCVCVVSLCLCLYLCLCVWECVCVCLCVVVCVCVCMCV